MNPLILKYLNFSNEEKSFKKIKHFSKNENYIKIKNEKENEKLEGIELKNLNLKKEKIKEKLSISNSLEEKLASLRRNTEKSSPISSSVSITSSSSSIDSKQKKIRSLKQIDETEANQKIKEYTQSVKKRKTMKCKLFF